MDLAKLRSPSLADIETLAEQALATIPAELRAHVVNLVIRVDDLYRGRMRPERSVVEPMAMPDMIHLYRMPILLHWCDSEERLGELIRHVLIHEIGHYFGYSDEDMERIEGAS
jgi:predicted Zn-dependent protease with MMP-like domain